MPEVLDCTSELAEKIISEYKNKSMEIFQTEEQNEQSLKKKMNDPERPVGQYYYANVYIIEILEREEREGQKKLEKIMIQNTPRFMKKLIYMFEKLNKMQTA